MRKLTLAAVKRRLRLGAKVAKVRDLLGTYDPPQVRTVAKVQGNAVAFATENSERLSWLWWPKASALEATPNGFRFMEANGEIGVEYLWVEGAK